MPIPNKTPESPDEKFSLGVNETLSYEKSPEGIDERIRDLEQKITNAESSIETNANAVLDNIVEKVKNEDTTEVGAEFIIDTGYKNRILMGGFESNPGKYSILAVVDGNLALLTFDSENEDGSKNKIISFLKGELQNGQFTLKQDKSSEHTYELDISSKINTSEDPFNPDFSDEYASVRCTDEEEVTQEDVKKAALGAKNFGKVLVDVYITQREQRAKELEQTLSDVGTKVQRLKDLANLEF